MIFRVSCWVFWHTHAPPTSVHLITFFKKLCIIWCTFTESSLFARLVNSNIIDNIYFNASIRFFQEQVITFQLVSVGLRIRFPKLFQQNDYNKNTLVHKQLLPLKSMFGACMVHNTNGHRRARMNFILKRLKCQYLKYKTCWISSSGSKSVSGWVCGLLNLLS